MKRIESFRSSRCLETRTNRADNGHPTRTFLPRDCRSVSKVHGTAPTLSRYRRFLRFFLYSNTILSKPTACMQITPMISAKSSTFIASGKRQRRSLPPSRETSRVPLTAIRRAKFGHVSLHREQRRDVTLRGGHAARFATIVIVVAAISCLGQETHT